MRISDWSSDVCSSDLTVISEALNILGQSLRKSYLPDLILRHTKAVKSQTARASGGSVGRANQLNTIRLNPAPVRGVGGKPYKSPPPRGGKLILVIHDLCPQGTSLAPARAYLRARGPQTFCVRWHQHNKSHPLSL